MDGQLTKQSDSPFDALRRIDENGQEYWTGRDIAPLFGYEKWQTFDGAIKRAMVSCQSTHNLVTEHFLPAPVTILGRPMGDYRLSRLACYLIAQNGDPRKREIRAAQVFFVLKSEQADAIAAELAQVKEAQQAHEIKQAEEINNRLARIEELLLEVAKKQQQSVLPSDIDAAAIAAEVKAEVSAHVEEINRKRADELRRIKERNEINRFLKKRNGL